MADYTFPDINKLNRLRAEGATTSANVGVYEKPLGTGELLTKVPKRAPVGADQHDRYFDPQEFLDRMNGR